MKAEQYQTIKITPAVREAKRQAIQAALAYQRETGRKLGITGEIGELIACEHPKLKLQLLQDPIAAGFDAVDNRGKTYQIKTRRVTGAPGKLGSFAQHPFDYAIFVLLGFNYQLVGLYKASYSELEPLIERYPRRNPSVNQFVNIADKII